MTESTQIMIVGNKMDLEDKREVSFQEGQELAEHSGFEYMECSAKSGESVNEVFTRLATMMKHKIIDNADKEPSSPLPGLPPPSRSRCCQ